MLGYSPYPGILSDLCYYITQADVQVCNDAVAALASGTGGHLHGIVLIAGTGKPLRSYQHDPLGLCCSGSHSAALHALLHMLLLGLDPLLGLPECMNVADGGGSRATIAMCSADRCLS